MAKYINKSDLAITSNGRTVYEIASLEVPCITISQNEREMRHLFSYLCNGIINMGIASNVSNKDITSTIKKMIESYDLRKNMNEALKEFNLKNGTNRVIRLIYEKYWESMDNEKNSNW